MTVFTFFFSFYSFFLFFPCPHGEEAQWLVSIAMQVVVKLMELGQKGCKVVFGIHAFPCGNLRFTPQYKTPNIKKRPFFFKIQAGQNSFLTEYVNFTGFPRGKFPFGRSFKASRGGGGGAVFGWVAPVFLYFGVLCFCVSVCCIGGLTHRLHRFFNTVFCVLLSPIKAWYTLLKEMAAAPRCHHGGSLRVVHCGSHCPPP